VDAVEEIPGRSDSRGMRFGREDGTDLLVRAGNDAVGDGRTRAAALAQANLARSGVA
jgi:hypothetical protein